MCTVSIKVDEARVRRIDPALTTNDSISQWLQREVDALIERYDDEKAGLMDLETMREKLHQMVREIYSQP